MLVILDYHKKYNELNKEKVAVKKRKEYLNKYKFIKKYNQFKQYYNLIDYPLKKIIQFIIKKKKLKNNPKYKFKVEFILTNT